MAKDILPEVEVQAKGLRDAEVLPYHDLIDRQVVEERPQGGERPVSRSDLHPIDHALDVHDPGARRRSLVSQGGIEA